MPSPPSNVPPLQAQMKKVLFTTYRKIFSIAKKVDKSIPMRCCIACSPSRVYDGRKEIWEPLEVAKMCQWPPSRVFLDSLIRRLNGQRQFFFPLTSTVSSPRKCEKMSSSVDLSGPSCTPTGEAIREVFPFPRSIEGVEARQHSVSFRSTGTISHQLSFSGKEQQQFLSVPSFITSETTIAEAARALFENTPFSMHHLNNAFAAVKELTYLSRHPLHNPSHFISPRLHELQSKVFFSASTSLPIFSHCTSKSRTNTPLFRQLAEDVRRHLDAESAAALQRSSQRSEENNSTECSATTKIEAPDLTDCTISAVLHSADLSGTVSENEKDHGHATKKESSSCSSSHFLGVGAETSSTAELSARVSSIPSNTEVNLLVSHPQLRGYFRHSVMLVVQHNSHSSVAIVLNKVLLSEHKYIMPLRSVVRLIKTHDIFSVYLKDHSVMLGGPVISSNTERSLTLLHRVPNVRDACQVGQADLWLNGDYDELKAKLDRKEASPDDIAVLCGFAGWGSQQLEGEIGLGTWMVASSSNSSFTGEKGTSSSSAAALDETNIEKTTSNSSENHEKQLTFDAHNGAQGISETSAETLGKYIFELIKTSSRQVSLAMVSTEQSSLVNYPASAVQSAASGGTTEQEPSESIFLKSASLRSNAIPDLLLGTVGEEREEDEDHVGENSFIGGGSSISAEERIPLGGVAAWASLFQTFTGKMKEACYI